MSDVTRFAACCGEIVRAGAVATRRVTGSARINDTMTLEQDYRRAGSARRWCRGSLIVVATGPAPQALYIGSQPLRGQSPLCSRPARLRRFACPGPNGGLLNQRGETSPSGVAVLSLCAMFPAVEYEHALGGHAAACKSGQARFDRVGKRRRADVEAQLNGGGDLVHLLPARSRRSYEPLLDLALVRRKRAVDRSHRSPRVRVDQPTTAPSSHWLGRSGTDDETNNSNPDALRNHRDSMLRCAQAGATFSARGPFGPCPTVNVTVWPSRKESNGVLVHADW